MTSPQLIPGFFALAALAIPPALPEQRAGQSEKLEIGATVEPTCTVAVVDSTREAVQVACRNMRVGQPQPILLDAGKREGRDVVLVRF